MFIHMMKSKIHRATVTESNLNYVGSITIDKNLMDKANLVENEKVQIVNNNNGNRFETYIIEGKAGSKIICLNGAAARLVQPGDKIIIISYAIIDKIEANKFKPNIIVLDDNNNIEKVVETEIHGQI
jgi:aspartate 1-decarboxylase